MRIVLDAMGSDNAPGPEVEGAVNASLEGDMEIILVGDEPTLKKALDAYPKHGHISIVHASERVLMEDSPMVAIRKKKDSSLLVGMRLVKDGKADGFLSAGNTGAVMLGSRVVIGPIPGVARSAICQVLPTLNDSKVVVLDLGANVDCTAEHLCQFAEMGQVYSQLTLGVKKPRVGLINIGEEQAKGNDIAKTVHRNLTAAEHIHFIGNIEPKALFAGKADVVVCDGFIGNIILKTSESVAALIKTMLEKELRATLISTIGAALSIGAFKRLKKRTDPNMQTGAPLLGVNGVVIIVHGSCNAEGIKNALLAAREEIDLGLMDHIREGIIELREEVEHIRKLESTT
ncbi:MAG: phosphate acyltransferase [Candidatus Hydrogenedentota bacterium]|nr:MAG: phosphate acyltransferase [Candidatus Hydrogenedentota bacterium]